MRLGGKRLPAAAWITVKHTTGTKAKREKAKQAGCQPSRAHAAKFHVKCENERRKEERKYNPPTANDTGIRQIGGAKVAYVLLKQMVTWLGSANRLINEQIESRH